MKILLLHSDFVEFEPKTKALKSAEEVVKERKRVEDCLVVFIAVEKRDEKNNRSAKKLADEVRDVAGQVKARRVVLYPYAHLSKDLASPDAALRIMKEAQEILKKDFEVSRAPFGWYKEFTIKCKGHPLAELSREIASEESPDSKQESENESESLKQEEKVHSTWFILTPKSELSEIKIDSGNLKGFDFKGHENLRKFASYEIAKVRTSEKEPPHVRLMRKLEIADYEPGSDPGNLRFYPKGRLIKSLLEAWVTQKAIEYGAMEIESPIMYDYEHPALKDYLNRFPARQYVVESAKKKFFMRFAACFGQFLMKANASISYRNLPLKMYELAKSFRLEKAGELTGLRRLRAFTMPDMHTLCKDLAQAREEFKKQFHLGMECMSDIGFEPDEYETAIRFTEDFWKENNEFVISLAKLLKKPVLIEMWNFRYAYFDPKFEFNIVDALDKCSALTTVQIDHENAKRYGIQYTDFDNTRKYPTILHCSPSGGIERVMYAILEKAWLKDEKHAVLPLWLSPVQVRLCPVNKDFLKLAEEISAKLEKEQIRVDIDDREMTIQKKILESETEWNPMAVVIGEKEKKSGKLAVRLRESGKVESMKLEEVVKIIRSKTKGFPFKPLTLPKLLTKRPVFVG